MNIEPLASRMRPSSITEVAGQHHILGEGKMLSRMVKAQKISSIILYGPPGVGKTSIAHALSKDLNVPFKRFNASTDTKKDLQNIVIGISPINKAIVLLDEIHRLTKPNQDFLLQYIEEGSLIMVGATTENPYMSIVPALRSRTTIFELKPLAPKDVKEVVKRTLNDKSKGFGNKKIDITDENIIYIATQSNGDVRVALNTLELAVMSTEEDEDGKITINEEVIDSCLQSRQIGGDKDGDTHYNLLSAFQKSIRGSDADASLHYLARLIEGGDLVSILRRLLVISYEDIGLLDRAIHLETLSVIETAERVGLPEARIPLSYITIRLALSPKSNVAYKAIERAANELQSNKDLQIPKDLHDNHYFGAKSLGKGIGYKYPHDYKHGITPQQYLPDDFKEDRYLRFRDENDTKNIQKIYNDINKVLKE